MADSSARVIFLNCYEFDSTLCIFHEGYRQIWPILFWRNPYNLCSSSFNAARREGAMPALARRMSHTMSRFKVRK